MKAQPIDQQFIVSKNDYDKHIFNIKPLPKYARIMHKAQTSIIEIFK